MAKYLLALFMSFFFVSLVLAQNDGVIVTGSSEHALTRDASAVLEANSDDQGMLAPRLTLAQRNAIVLPATSLLIFQTDNTPGYYYNSGTPAFPVWERLTVASGVLTGSGAATQVAFWNSASTLASNANLYWDNTNNRLGIGTAVPGVTLDVFKTAPVANEVLFRVATDSDPARFSVDEDGDMFMDGTADVSGDVIVRGSDVYDNSGDLRLSAEDNVYIGIDYNNDDADLRSIIFGKNSFTVPTELMRISENGTVQLSTYLTNGLVRTTGGTGLLTSGGALNLTSEVTGILPVPNGGTGAGTLTGYVYGNGIGPMTASTTIPNSALAGSGQITVAASGVGLSVTGSPVALGGTVTIASNATSANTASTIVSRDASGNFSAGQVNANLNGQWRALDDRIIEPNSITSGHARFGFTSYSNNNTAPWADFIHLRSYTDASGGNDNMITLSRSSIAMRVWQQAWNSASPYATYKTVAFIEDLGNFSGLANPTTMIGLTAINGVATTAMRSDGAPALSQAIVPTWTGLHTFTNGTYSALFTGGNVGVGNAAPMDKLQVSGGNILLNDVAGQTPYQLRSYNNGTSLWFISGSSTASQVVVGTAHDWDRAVSFDYTPNTTGSSAGVLNIGQLSKNHANYTHGITRFYTNGSDKMSIASNGDIALSTKIAFRSNDAWLRLNPTGAFTSGIYVANFFRVDGGIASGGVGTPGAGAITATSFVNSNVGYRVNSAAPSGQYLRGNGTNFVASGIVASDVPTLNQNTTGNAATATNVSYAGVTNIPTRTDWNSPNNHRGFVAEQLSWKNYGNSHTIFDASQGTSPSGTAVNNTTAQIPWSATYPTLMGWNGANTYGVRVDVARYAESAPGDNLGNHTATTTLNMNGNVINNFRRLEPLGIGGDSGEGNNAYAIFQEGGAWNWPYPDLRIAFHTGIKLGANASYNGVRFYTDYDMSSMVMSVNDGSTGGAGNVYLTGSLGVNTAPSERIHVSGGNIRWANSILRNDQGGTIELGGKDDIAGVGTPYIDWHVNSGYTRDYDIRMIGSTDAYGPVMTWYSYEGNTLYRYLDFDWIGGYDSWADVSAWRYYANDWNSLYDDLYNDLDLIDNIRPKRMMDGKTKQENVTNDPATVPQFLGTYAKDNEDKFMYDINRVSWFSIGAIRQLRNEGRTRETMLLDRIERLEALVEKLTGVPLGEMDFTQSLTLYKGLDNFVVVDARIKEGDTIEVTFRSGACGYTIKDVRHGSFEIVFPSPLTSDVVLDYSTVK